MNLWVIFLKICNSRWGGKMLHNRIGEIFLFSLFLWVIFCNLRVIFLTICYSALGKNWRPFPWWRHQMEIFPTLLVLCAGNSPVTSEFPTQRSVTQSFDVFFDLRLNKRLSKQSYGWWFETPWRPLWRHCNAWPSWGQVPRNGNDRHFLSTALRAPFLSLLRTCVLLFIVTLFQMYKGQSTHICRFG